MKQIYFLFLITLFSSNLIWAEPCPSSGTTSAGGTQIIFTYAAATSFCVNRPTSIEVNGTSTFTLDVGSCSETISLYNLTSGPAITVQDFNVTSGFDTTCSYFGGTLPIDDFNTLNKNLKIYPNPLTAGNTIKLSFGLPLKANIDLYNVSGKRIFQVDISNIAKKELDVANLANGIYMLKISSDIGTVTRKIVVLK